MRIRVAKLAAVVLGGVLWACSAPPPETAGLSEEDVAAIKATSEKEVVDVLLAGDWEAFAAAFTEDAVRMVPNEPLHVGRAAIEEWAAANWGGLTFSEGSQTVLEVDGRGDMAYARLAYSFTVEVPGLEEPITDVGKALIILRKQSDGSWLVSHSIYNADYPPPGVPQGG
ncbi:MAG: DUF4440 domain-containing protein [Gemmatimonadota bacterium]|nr:MAG: DUF4440 domain-containing protein [Gemmatimonadota bacterium]